MSSCVSFTGEGTSGYELSRLLNLKSGIINIKTDRRYNGRGFLDSISSGLLLAAIMNIRLSFQAFMTESLISLQLIS